MSKRIVRRIALISGLLVAAVVALGAGTAGWLALTLRGSLPTLEGELSLPGLTEPVTVERDALGIPTFRAARRVDLARALGFVHAQERFFQMDLSRRRAAGELSALLGAATIEADRQIRMHRLRHTARGALERLSPGRRAVFEAYADGVNQGLAALGDPPPEYLALRQDPRPWEPEDSFLVVLSLFHLLHDADGTYERSLAALRACWPEPLVEFLAPISAAPWDAPLIGPPLDEAPMPPSSVVDLRERSEDGEQPAADGTAPAPAEPLPGSNNWAVGAARTTDGRAILANDMHLPISVPNTWYRARWLVDSTPGGPVDVVGASVPGVPAMVVGSTGRIAWGFTNSYGDWTDVVELELDPDDASVYATPDGPRRFEVHQETLEVARGAPVTVTVRWTIWGPVVDEGDGPPVAIAWVAHHPEAVDDELVSLETVAGVEQALAVAAEAGLPAQNFVVADAEGNIGWTIAGVIPQRVGFSGRFPTSWADGTRRWDGWVPPEDYPRVVNPADGAIWTANARVAGGEALELIGDGNYDTASRAVIIRDALLAREVHDEASSLELQLDDRAVFLERWRELLLATLDDEALAERPERAEVRRLVEEDWPGRASVTSAGFRIVRGFRAFVMRDVLAPFEELCDRPLARSLMRFHQAEAPVWTLLRERPPHLLAPEHGSWRALLLDAIDGLEAQLTSGDARLAEQTWGRRNVFHARHPLSLAVPQLSRYLDMPPVALPGYADAPRVQGTRAGASQRMVVSPGHEDEAIFHMPGGQSGHFLSPYFRAGHDDWIAGRPTPLMPGEPQHVLRLTPTAPGDAP